MQPLLLDKGLPPVVAQGLAALGLDINAVGLPGAPPDNSSDDENCRWCLKNDAILVTTDRGRKDRAIMSALATHRIHAIFVYKEAPHRARTPPGKSTARVGT